VCSTADTSPPKRPRLGSKAIEHDGYAWHDSKLFTMDFLPRLAASTKGWAWALERKCAERPELMERLERRDEVHAIARDFEMKIRTST